MTKPLCIDLYCGLGGWAEGFLAEGYDVTGIDLEAHDYGTGGYPGKLILRDVLTIHGSEFKDAACIVGSSPCQRYSYMAMPWKRAKAMALYYGDKSHPERLVELNALFNAQFRIQREASRAAGHHIPMVVENVRGAQKWVGRAQGHYGSFYLWGDVPALMPPAIHAKVSGFRFDGESHGSFQSAAVAGLKAGLDNSEYGKCLGLGENCSEQRKHGSRSNSRKAASAMIAKIPFPLAQHIAKVFKPIEVE